MRRIATAIAAGVFAVTGAGFAGCGDDDNEGPAEEAGKAVDDAGNEAGEELKETERDLDDGKKD